ncbi:MAG: hypothetical protein FWE28_01225 [Oscillospiraceae bacterium]|nr:hypothetical protein [Oscillospiraceae bacterium]
MGTFEQHMSIQTMIGLFFIVLCLVVAVLGFLLWRFEFLDGKHFFFSRTLGAILMIASGVFAIAAVLMLVYVRIVL